MQHKILFLAGLLMISVLGGCAAAVDVQKIGNEYAQHAYSRNAWWPNWDRTIFCYELDENGFCPRNSQEKYNVVAMESVGQAATKQATSGIPVGIGLAYGLSNIDSNTSSAVGNQNVNQPGPWRGRYMHR